MLRKDSCKMFVSKEALAESSDQEDETKEDETK
jgi:hypothetical protein